MRVADVPNRTMFVRTVERHALNSQDRAMTEFWYDPLATSRLLADFRCSGLPHVPREIALAVWTRKSPLSRATERVV